MILGLNPPQFLGFFDFTHARYQNLLICSPPIFFWELPEASSLAETLFAALEMLETRKN